MNSLHFRILNKILQRNFSQAVPRDLTFQYLEGPQKGIAVCGLNRPSAKNAFSRNLLDELHKTIDKISFENKARVFVLRSMVPGAFCSGADLKERATMTPQEVSSFVSNLRYMMTRLHNLQIPIIAAIDGLALGGGLEIALACDIRIASETSKLGLVETKLAILPGAGGTQRLPRIINPSLAKELIFTARIFDGKYAKEIGIVNHVVPQNETEDAAYQKAISISEEILPNGPVAVKMAKLAINKGIEVDLHSGLSIEESCYQHVIPTKDRTEGLNAFKEKRRPEYVGQ
ncbi:unnamed protein product [Brassicogethes aeneus]|uniref:Methylglutaconyl-CoA hydratase, mitochondrial n=1 Tax=Brassicogethes aeneus TaxID=1431903 RepID=A0A9P0BJ63_BRAAE|nr:unnamed protein product [Brassicogethes aeneus]